MSLFGKRSPGIVHIQGNIQWKILHDRSTNTYVGVCEPLNLNAVGDTWVEVIECANEALGLLLSSLLKSGELQSFLRDQGWSASEMPAQGTTPSFDVPFNVDRVGSMEDLVAAHA